MGGKEIKTICLTNFSFCPQLGGYEATFLYNYMHVQLTMSVSDWLIDGGDTMVAF